MFLVGEEVRRIGGEWDGGREGQRRAGGLGRSTLELDCG